MGNSATKLADIVDFARSIGVLNPVQAVGGLALEPALTIANDVMTDLIAERFNWKWNRMVITPWVTNSWQQDYATVNLTNLGWIEHAVAVDINNTTLPKPIFWLECVRDLERTSLQFGRPEKICWLPNNQLVQDVWPGANKAIVNPLGANTMPANPIINILDTNGNIQILTTFGTTGGVAPSWPAASSAAGTTTADGTCVWTVANPVAQGFRVAPLPTQTSRTFQLYVAGQAKPPKLTALSQMIDPVPDDFAKYFRQGFIAYCHKHSSNAAVKAQFKEEFTEWMLDLQRAKKQADRERDDAAFVPARNIMGEPVALPVGPAWPFAPSIGS